MEKAKLIFTLLILSSFFSCSLKPKMTCDNKEAIEQLRYNIKLRLVECQALSYAAEDFEEWRYGIYGYMNSEYQQYLLDNYEYIKSKEGKYYLKAAAEMESKTIVIDNILAVSYDEKIDKCNCTANVKTLDDNNEIVVTFDNIRNSEGRVSGHFICEPKIMLDSKTSAIDFINKYIKR
jgi:hypothetical protein